MSSKNINGFKTNNGNYFQKPNLIRKGKKLSEKVTDTYFCFSVFSQLETEYCAYSYLFPGSGTGSLDPVFLLKHIVLIAAP